MFRGGFGQEKSFLLFGTGSHQDTMPTALDRVMLGRSGGYIALCLGSRNMWPSTVIATSRMARLLNKYPEFKDDGEQNLVLSGFQKRKQRGIL